MTSANRETETYHSSLGPVNITSFDSMQEIAIHDGANQSSSSAASSARHHRPATLPLEPSLAAPGIHSNDIITNSSAIITAGTPGGNRHTPIDALKEWSLSTYKCTKQLINEKLGKCTRTVDADLEIEIEKLRDTQHKYENILKLSKDMANQYGTIISTQNAMYEHLNELALRETGTKSSQHSSIGGSNSSNNDLNNGNLSSDFKKNAEMMRNIAKNGEKLLMALRFFISNLTTLIYKTIEDTIITIRAFENARLEYDAERNAMIGGGVICQTSGSQTTTTTTGSNTANNIDRSEKISQTKAKYERLKEDVTVKMKFLEENKAKVMHKQLVLFYNAFASFASGNATALDSTLKQFSIRQQTSSFLEK